MFTGGRNDGKSTPLHTLINPNFSQQMGRCHIPLSVSFSVPHPPFIQIFGQASTTASNLKPRDSRPRLFLTSPDPLPPEKAKYSRGDKYSVQETYYIIIMYVEM
jgi:hypothetical protein